MRLLKTLLPLLVLLMWGTVAKADYNPTNPPEPGVYFSLTTRCIPSNAAYSITPSGTRAFGTSLDIGTYPATGFRFIQWEDENGNIVSTTPDFIYTMPAKDVTLIARFVYDPSSPAEPSTPEFKDTSYISFKMNPSDAGYVYYGYEGEYEVGSTHSFSVSSNENYRFVNWTCEGMELGTSPTLEYTVPKGDRVLVANFAYDPTSPSEPGGQRPSRLLTIQSNPKDAGSVRFLYGSYYYDDGLVEEGVSVPVSASANTYYSFINWTDDEGSVVSVDPSFHFTMPNRKVTLTANFSYYYNPSSPDEPGIPNPDGSAAENMVLWPRMGMYDDTHVQILCETPGATIHYTLDGSTPTAASPIYTEPVFVASNLLVKAIAYKEGMEDSPVVSYQVMAYKAGTPIFTFENRKLKITSGTPGAIIRYTTDFTDPTEESTVYTTPFEPEENCRIKAYASKEGLTDSPINIFVFRQADYTIPAPTFSLNDDGKLVIIPSVSGGVTRYTLDGTEPDAASTVYTEPLTLDGNFTVRAYTTHASFYDSPVGEYVIEGYKVAEPTCSYTNLALALAVATPGASIRYTTDGTMPTDTATLYTAPLRLIEDCKIVARGFKDHYEPSDTISYTFVYADHVVATPVFAYDNESHNVSISCATENAEIRYTTDGSEPTATSGEVYTGPIPASVYEIITGDGNIIARAFRNDLFDSESEILQDLQSLSIDMWHSWTNWDASAEINESENLELEDNVGEILDIEKVILGHGEVFGRLFADLTGYAGIYGKGTPGMPIRFIFNRPDMEGGDAPFSECDPTFDENGEFTFLFSQLTATEIKKFGTAYPYVHLNTIKMPWTFPDGIDQGTVVKLNYIQHDQVTPTPKGDFSDRKLILSCSDANASIFYTTDGTAPTLSSTLYTGPISLTSDCKVNFIAKSSGYFVSSMASFEFKYAEHQVATPVLTYDPEALTINMTCATVDAEIRYTIDGEAPTENSGLKYEGPVAVVGNHTFNARAFRSDLFDSEPASLTIDDLKLPTPTASYGKHFLTLACENEASQIHYTVNGDRPTSASTLYSEPIPMTEDCTVRFFASRAGYNDSDEASYNFVLSQWKETLPTITKDFEGRRVFVENAVGTGIRVLIDGEERLCKSLDSIYVVPDMRLIQVTSVATNEDRYDSDTISEQLVFHLPPKLRYDGHAVHYGPAEEEPAPKSANASLYMNNVYRHGGSGERSMEVTYMARLTAVTTSNDAFRSDTIAMDIDYFNTGRVAAARNGHRLAEGFGTWGDSPEDYSYLYVNGGEIEKEDLQFLGSLPNLTALNFAPNHTTTDPCDSVFAKSPLETIFAYSIPQGMFKGMRKLTTVMWGIINERMPEGRLTEAGNPNILLWVFDETKAPSDATNIVTYPYIGGDAPTDPEGIGVRGEAKQISLQAGYPFGAHMPIDVDHIELTKQFSMPTVIGECAGWEALTLPFDATSIRHEREGEIVPFSIWSGPEESAKPFWLYSASEQGWAAANSIKACTPYIISMPNNEEYVYDYNLPGKVTFAADDVTLDPDSLMPKADKWLDSTEFVGTFMPVEEKGIRSLNVNLLADRDWLGSAFVSEDETLPFGAYLRGEGMPKQVPVFSDWSGVMTPVADASGIVVENPAAGTIRVSSSRECKLAVTTATGIVIRTLHLKAGENIEIEGLTRDLYIVAGVKVMVR